jgi:hypothetical protein
VTTIDCIKAIGREFEFMNMLDAIAKALKGGQEESVRGP